MISLADAVLPSAGVAGALNEVSPPQLQSSGPATTTRQLTESGSQVTEQQSLRCVSGSQGGGSPKEKSTHPVVPASAGVVAICSHVSGGVSS